MLRPLLRLLTFRRVEVAAFPSHPLRLAALWLLGAMALAAGWLAVEGSPYGAGRGFIALGMQVLAGFAVGGLLGSWDDAPRYAAAFVLLGLVAAAVPLLAGLDGRSEPFGDLAAVLAGLWTVLAAIRLIAASAIQALPRQRLVAMAAAALLFPLGANFYALEAALADRVVPAEAYPAPVKVDHEALWTAQPGLLAKATAALPAKPAKAPRVYTLAIAAGGSQAIFGREAEAVRDLFVRRLGKNAPSVLLSNGAAHHATVPLANRDNLSAVLGAIGQRYDPDRDLALIFLTAHGGPDAALQTDLPDAYRLRAIDAPFLAAALAKAGIVRRIVVVSACFSGSWIKPLASPDTIVLTAASATRTSFGCDDRLRYTYFGSALLGGSLGEGATWRAAFTKLQDDILEQEAKLGAPPSLPMASVGARMEAVWNAPLGKGGR